MILFTNLKKTVRIPDVVRNASSSERKLLAKQLADKNIKFVVLGNVKYNIVGRK